MSENQYKSPVPASDRDRQNPMLNRVNLPRHDRSLFRFAIVLLTGGIGAGIAARVVVHLFGAPRLTLGGKAVFFAIGFVPGIAIAAVIHKYLDDRGTLPKWEKGARFQLLLLWILVVGVCVGCGAIFYLGRSFFTIPTEWWEFLFV
jgi:hypothetical protein